MKMLIVLVLMLCTISFAADASKDAPPQLSLEEAVHVLDLASMEYHGTLQEHQRIRQAVQVVYEGCIKPKEKESKSKK